MMSLYCAVGGRRCPHDVSKKWPIQWFINSLWGDILNWSIRLTTLIKLSNQNTTSETRALFWNIVLTRNGFYRIYNNDIFTWLNIISISILLWYQISWLADFVIDNEQCVYLHTVNLSRKSFVGSANMFFLEYMLQPQTDVTLLNTTWYNFECSISILHQCKVKYPFL